MSNRTKIVVCFENLPNQFIYSFSSLLFSSFFSFYCVSFRLGGLDLSRHALDRESRSLQFEKGHLDSQDFLDSLKNNILTVKIFLTVWKMTSWQISTKSMLQSLDLSKFFSLSRLRLLILTFQKLTTWLSRKSWQFENGHLNMLRHLNLDLDCSRLLRPPSLVSFLLFLHSTSFF